MADLSKFDRVRIGSCKCNRCSAASILDTSMATWILDRCWCGGFWTTVNSDTEKDVNATILFLRTSGYEGEILV